MTELEDLTRKWREWCEAHAPTGAVPLERVPRLLLALVNDEREACAQIADNHARRSDFSSSYPAASCADAIAYSIRTRNK
jgi:hypothetical protein